MKPNVEQVEAKPRKIGFEAPEEIHGAIKLIVGWAAMNKIRPSEKPFSERELLQGLVAGFWAAGQDSWESLILSNSQSLEKIITPPRKARKTD